MSRFLTSGRLSAIVARGAPLYADVAGAVLSATLDLSATEVSQLSLTLDDRRLEVLGRGLFTAGTLTTAGSQLDYAGFKMECRAVELSPSGTLTVTARSLGVCKLRRARGALVRRSLSPTTFAGIEAHAAGLKFVGQPSPKRSSIIRTTATADGGEAETSWDTLQRLAKELGFLCFEAGGILYFGTPTWFVGRTSAASLTVGISSSTHQPVDDRVLSRPSLRTSGDDARRVATLDVDVTYELGATLLPGHRLDLSGVPGFSARYMIDKVTLDLASDAPASVSASTPVNPTPEPPEVPGAGTVKTPKAGTYAGTKFTSAQLGNAATIYRAAYKAGAGSRGATVGITVALQESSLYNLKGGDKDSAGLFQQRAPWGPYEDRTNPTKSAALFYNGGRAAGTPGLKDLKGWERMSISVAAQKVQRSKYPSAYKKWEAEATAIVRAIAATATAGPSGAGAGDKSAELMVRIALGQAGDRYVYGAEAKLSDKDPDAFDCSELVQWAVAQAGGSIPDGSSAQYATCRKHHTTLTVAQAIKTRGALLFRGPGGNEHVAISLGNGKTIEARGRAYGVCEAPATASRFTLAGKVPGLHY